MKILQNLSPQNLSPKNKASLLLVAGVLAISLSPIFVRYADAPGLVIAFYRMLIASLLLIPSGLAGLRKSSLSRQNLGLAIAAGACLALHFALWISSIFLTSIAASATLGTTTPLWIALLGWLFLAIRPRWQVMAGMAMAITGGAIIASAEHSVGSQPLLGNSMAFIAAILAASYFLLTRSAQKRGLHFQAAVFVVYGSAALFLLPLPLIFGMSYIAYPWQSFFWMLMMALIPQLVGHSSFNYAMQYLNPTLVSTLILLEPIGASILAFFLLQESPSQQVLWGGAITLLGVIISSLYNRVGQND